MNRVQGNREKDVTAEAVRGIKTAFAAMENIQLVVLFGSRANGTASRESDIDIGIRIDPAHMTSRRALLQQCAEALSPFFASHKLDMVFLNDASPLLRHRVAGESRVLYERCPGDMQRFTIRAIRDYQDTAYQRDFFQKDRIRRLKKGLPHGGSGDILTQARKAGRLLAEAQGVPEHNP